MKNCYRLLYEDFLKSKEKKRKEFQYNIKFCYKIQLLIISFSTSYMIWKSWYYDLKVRVFSFDYENVLQLPAPPFIVIGFLVGVFGYLLFDTWRFFDRGVRRMEIVINDEGNVEDHDKEDWIYFYAKITRIIIGYLIISFIIILFDKSFPMHCCYSLLLLNKILNMYFQLSSSTIRKKIANFIIIIIIIIIIILILSYIHSENIYGIFSVDKNIYHLLSNIIIYLCFINLFYVSLGYSYIRNKERKDTEVLKKKLEVLRRSNSLNFVKLIRNHVNEKI